VHISRLSRCSDAALETRHLVHSRLVRAIVRYRWFDHLQVECRSHERADEGNDSNDREHGTESDEDPLLRANDLRGYFRYPFGCKPHPPAVLAVSCQILRGIAESPDRSESEQRAEDGQHDATDQRTVHELIVDLL
jgi:hypothetical protein